MVKTSKILILLITKSSWFEKITKKVQINAKIRENDAFVKSGPVVRKNTRVSDREIAIKCADGNQAYEETVDA